MHIVRTQDDEIDSEITTILSDIGVYIEKERADIDKIMKIESKFICLAQYSKM